MSTPYTTASGLRIGCMYQPTTKPYHDKDALLIQTALLNQREAGPIERALVRLVRRLWAWC